MAATTEQEPWTPTVEWLTWAERFDAGIGFREEHRSAEEHTARARAETDVRHRGSFGTAQEGDHGVPWCVSTDRPTTTPLRAARRAIHDWVVTGENRARAERRSGILRAMEEQGVEPGLSVLSDDHEVVADLGSTRIRHRNRTTTAAA